jgi:tetratricopeptide (TPR) repeat protein
MDGESEGGDPAAEAAAFQAAKDAILIEIAKGKREAASAMREHKGSPLVADRDVVLAAVALDGDALQYAAPALKADREVVLVAVAQSGPALMYASRSLKGDKSVVLAAVALDGLALRCASTDLRGDEEVVLVAVAQNGKALPNAAPELQVSEHIHFAAMGGEAAFHAAKRAILAEIAKGKMKAKVALQYADAALKSNKEVVLAAVAQNGEALKFAARVLKADKEFVRLAEERSGVAPTAEGRRAEWHESVKKAEAAKAAQHETAQALLTGVAAPPRPSASEWGSAAAPGVAAGAAPTAARGVVQPPATAARESAESREKLEKNARKRERKQEKRRQASVVRTQGTVAPAAPAAAAPAGALPAAPVDPELRKAKDAALVEIAKGRRFAADALKFAPRALRVDKDVVLAALAHDGLALKHAAPELQGDREIVLAAVAQYGPALRFATPALQGDRTVVFAALAQNGNALQYAAPALKADKEIVLAAVANKGKALEHAAHALKKDPDVVLAAVDRSVLHFFCLLLLCAHSILWFVFRGGQDGARFGACREGAERKPVVHARRDGNGCGSAPLRSQHRRRMGTPAGRIGTGVLV